MFTDYHLLRALEKEVADDNVSCSTLGEYKLFKYSTPCHIYSRWNEYNRQARGIIFHGGRVVCRPFSKFFNLDEREETKLENLPTSDFIILEKLDGSCVSTFIMDGKLHCATPGSMISDQAQWGLGWLNKHFSKPLTNGKLPDYESFLDDNQNYTYVFEAIYPANTNVVLYSGREELVLLTIFKHSGEELGQVYVENAAKMYGFSRPRQFKFDLSRTLQFPANEEGYVAYWPKEGLRVKIKSPEYVYLHKQKENFNPKGICEILADGNFANFASILPQHMQLQLDDIAAGLRQKFFDIKNRVEDTYYKVKNLPTRKEQALTILSSSNKDVASLIFSKLDDTPIDIWNRLVWRKVHQDISEAMKKDE